MNVNEIIFLAFDYAGSCKIFGHEYIGLAHGQCTERRLQLASNAIIHG